MKRLSRALPSRCVRQLLLLSAILLLPLAEAVEGAEPDSGARQFAAEALALRAAGLAGRPPAVEVLAAMPGAGAAGIDAEVRGLVWRPFFANAIVKLGRMSASAPVALYYNPLLDVALYTFWRTEADGLRVAASRARTGDDTGAVTPAWMASEDDPLEALVAATAGYLDAFRREHPAVAAESGRDTVTFADAARELRPVLRRLLWNAARITSWAEEAQSWLPPALAGIERALAARDPAALRAAAPETDAETAALLSELPPGFAAGLALDMILEAPEGGRLLVGSLPGDGDVYVLAQCRLDGAVCRLRRFALLSLLD